MDMGTDRLPSNLPIEVGNYYLGIGQLYERWLLLSALDFSNSDLEFEVEAVTPTTRCVADTVVCAS